MTDPRRPNTSHQTELRRSVSATTTELPVISLTGFRADADKQVGDEFVRCASFITDAYGWPVLSGCQRGVAQEDGGSAPRGWPAGTPVFEVGWTAVDILTEIPEPTLDMVGRQFVYQDGEGNVYTFNVGVLQDGTPFIDWVNEPPGEEGGANLALASAVTGLDGPWGVAIDASGNVYVQYFGASPTVRKYDPSLVAQWTQTLLATGYLATDGTTVFLSDPAGHQVLRRLASTGAAGSPASFGTSGTSPNQFNGPRGIATDGTHVFVVDQGNDRLHKWTVAGTWVDTESFDIVGSAVVATGAAVDATHVYVLIPTFGRIEKRLKSDLSLVATLSLGVGNADGQISSSAEGIAIDSDGNIWVADTGNHRIQVFDGAGAFLAKVGSFGSDAGQLKAPRQLAFTAADIGYVADTGNDRLSSVRVVPPGITPVVTIRSNSDSHSSNQLTVTVTCNVGEVMVGGGGGYTTGGFNNPLLRSYPSAANTWSVTGSNNTGTSRTLEAYALCMATPLVEG